MSARERVHPSVADVCENLLDNGYAALPDPLPIGNVNVEGLNAWLGPKSTPDVLVVFSVEDDTNDVPLAIEATRRLARALDAIPSTRGITVVLVRPRPSQPISVDAFLELGRVVVVAGELELAQQLAPLFAFDPPNAQTITGGSENQANLLSKYAIQADRAPLTGLIESAAAGTRAVESALEQWLDGAFESERGDADE